MKTFFDACAGRDAPTVASDLVLLLDYDLTLSAPTASECHHMLRDAAAVPAGFRRDVQTLFDARDEAHPDHAAIYGSPSDDSRPHRFWAHYNALLVRHKITRRMIDEAVAEEKQRQGVRGRSLLREGVGDLLALCDTAGIAAVLLSAGLEPVIRSAFVADGVPLPASCHVLTNRLLFDGASGGCIAVEPSDPPASREGKLTMLGGLSCLAHRSLVLMVGDKPVDAFVARGLPPLSPAANGVAGRGERGERGERAELAFGFFNAAARAELEPTEAAADLNEWRAAFHILAHNGSVCTLAPVTALVRHLLGAAAPPRPSSEPPPPPSSEPPPPPPQSLLQVAASRAAAERREPSLRELNSLFASEGMEAISEGTRAAFLEWARAHDVVMDDETYCDFCADRAGPVQLQAGSSTSSAGTADHTAAPGSASTVHRLLDDFDRGKQKR